MYWIRPQNHKQKKAKNKQMGLQQHSANRQPKEWKKYFQTIYQKRTNLQNIKELKKPNNKIRNPVKKWDNI